MCVYKRVSLSKTMRQLSVMILKFDLSVNMICLLRSWLHLIVELVKEYQVISIICGACD